MEIILTRFLSFQTPIVRIGFGFLPGALSAIMFGPVIGGITGMLSDIIGMALFPKGAYFPGFTFSALMSGVIYGIFLYKKPKSILRIFMAILTITIFVDLGLNTLWLSMITGKAVLVLFPPRLIKSLITLPINTLLLHTVWRYIGNYVQSNYLNRNTYKLK